MKYNILCDLDALLDTRLAVYKTMGDETFTKVLNSGWAKVRHTDAVEGTDFELFKKLYAKRDESILQYADVTSVIDFIMDIYKINKGFSMQDKEPPPIVFINTYPYKITEEEEELLLTIIENTGIEHVELISINTAQSGPSLLRYNYDVVAVIKYDMDVWLAHHFPIETENDNMYPDLKIYIPSVIQREYDGSLRSLINTPKGNIFDAQEKFFDRFISIQYIASVLFTSIKAITADEIANKKED